MKNNSINSLPSNIKLMMFLLALITYLKPYVYKVNIDIPFFSISLSFPWHEHFQTVLATLMLGSVILVGTKYWRIGCIAIFFVLIVAHFSCRPCYADSRIYLSALFFLLSVYTKELGSSLIRWQICVLYLGAGINKLFDVHWHSGEYMNYWLKYREVDVFGSLAQSMSNELLIYQVISYSVIISELGMAVLFFTRRDALGVWFGLIFHGPSMLVVNGTFGSFVPSVLTSYLVFLNWPKSISLSIKRIPKWNLASFLDPIHLCKDWSIETGSFMIKVDKREYQGFKALIQLLIYSPLAYLAVVIVLLLPFTPVMLLVFIVVGTAITIAVHYSSNVLLRLLRK